MIAVPHFVNRGTSLPGRGRVSRRDRGFHKLAGPSPARAQCVQPVSCWREGGESTAAGQGRGRCDPACARARVTAHPVECACARVCVPGGRREVLAASLGTYKSCGRICLRCQLKAFSNVCPTPSRTGEREGSEPNLPPAPRPPPGPRAHTAGARTTLSPGPASPLVGPKLEGGRAAAASPPPSLGEGQKSGPFQATILQLRQKRPQNGAALAVLGPAGTSALRLACFSCHHPEGRHGFPPGQCPPRGLEE